MDRLIDNEGNVYERGLGGAWHPEQGAFGPVKDTNIFGQPNVEQGLFGPTEARGPLGRTIRGEDDRPLYQPISSPASTSGGSSAGEALLVVLGAMALVWIVSALIALVSKLFAGVIEAWRGLEKRYPRAVLAVKLAISMVAVHYGLVAAGFDLRIQIAGVALVPGLWGWLWLTRKVPTIFLPINALLTGSVLWLGTEIARPFWLPTWSRLTVGLPLLVNLSIVLAVLPMMLLLQGAGARRWPNVFTPINLLVIGAVMWFVLVRVWTDWIPLWTSWTAPVPFMLPVGWMIFLIPLVLWLWHKGQGRWPVPFFVGNLLLFGGLLGLAAYHTQPAWIGTWHYWMVGLPFVSIPIAAISFSPITLWGWSRISRYWPRVFVIPNLLITGGILWLILERTRPVWTATWHRLWGEVPLVVDPAILVLALPCVVWAWRRSSLRWPRFGVALRVFLLGALLWWIGERTRVVWQDYWLSFAGQSGPNLAVLAAITPPLLWSWVQLRKRWMRVSSIIGLAVLSLGLSWITGRLLPASTLMLRVTVAVIPLITWGLVYLLRRRTRLGWILLSIPLISLGLLGWLMPRQFQMLMQGFLYWLAKQGVPVPMNGM